MEETVKKMIRERIEKDRHFQWLNRESRLLFLRSFREAVTEMENEYIQNS